MLVTGPSEVAKSLISGDDISCYELDDLLDGRHRHGKLETVQIAFSLVSTLVYYYISFAVLLYQRFILVLLCLKSLFSTGWGY